ncbi:hypothetical protein AAON49_08135 [Pseudotenacibaculum sp. MALMAid0570]|uniref:hypothetical protein n=1 Tax=Pseudotenacibaculum sp. MALMAid0570 TaxID=3143938 RepID=UPI0032E01541
MRKNILRGFILVLLGSVMYSCLSSTEDSFDRDWVYLEIETVMKSDTSNSFIYGQMKKSIVERMKKNEKAKGIFFIENARYINNDDKLQIYEDVNDKGTLAYRIEHIQKIEFYKKDPVFLFDKDQLHISAIKHLKKHTQK